MLRDSEMALAVRSSWSCAGSVPLSASPDSHSAAMPPTGAVLVANTVGEVYT
jgi:hypothetical protein